MAKGFWIALGLGLAGAVGITAAVAWARRSPPTGSITISATPVTLPDTGGNVAVSVTTANIVAGTTMTLVANGTPVASTPLPDSGTTSFTWVAPANDTTSPVTDSLQVTAG